MKTLAMVLAVLVMATTSFALDVNLVDSQSGTTVSDYQSGTTDSKTDSSSEVVPGQTIKGEDLVKITPVKAEFVAGKVATAFISKYFIFEPVIVKEYIEKLITEIVYQTISEVVYQDRVVYIPVPGPEKIVYVEKIVEVPKECTNTCVKNMPMVKIFVARPDNTVTKSLLVKRPDGTFEKFEALTTSDWQEVGLYPAEVGSKLSDFVFSSPHNGDHPSDECLVYQGSRNNGGIWFVEDSTVRDQDGNLRLDPARLDFSDSTGYDALLRLEYVVITVDCNTL